MVRTPIPVITLTENAPQKYKIKGSFGHPVPVVDGRTQSSGGKAKGVVLQKEFTNEKDVFSIDYTSAYSTPNLDKLIRTFVYDRQGEGNFTVGDEFTAKTPIRFETANNDTSRLENPWTIHIFCWLLIPNR